MSISSRLLALAVGVQQHDPKRQLARGRPLAPLAIFGIALLILLGGVLVIVQNEW